MLAVAKLDGGRGGGRMRAIVLRDRGHPRTRARVALGGGAVRRRGRAVWHGVCRGESMGKGEGIVERDWGQRVGDNLWHGCYMTMAGVEHPAVKAR